MSDYGFFDLHRHDQASTFDGFGHPDDLAKIAKDLEYPALGISNHGTAYTYTSHYFACKDNDLIPVLGCEVYFQPKFNDQQRSGFHLCLFSQNEQGYFNVNKIMTEAEETKYYTSKVTLDYLKEYPEGVICTSACVAGPLSQYIIKGRYDLAEKLIRIFKDIYGEQFYIEIQPYKISDEGVQEKVNLELIKLAKKFGVKCILTSDSHMGLKSDFLTYKKMHEMSKAGLAYDIKATYGQRYMPSEEQIIKRFVTMHGDDFGKSKAKRMAIEMCENLGGISESITADYLDDIPLSLPKLHGSDDTESNNQLKDEIFKGLKRIGKSKDKEYVSRAKEEFKVIKYHGFADYFLIVQDYVKYAKDNDIAVGPGRGSVCNCLVAYLLDITTVDSIKFGLDFRRFLRMDKKKLPDIDLDFEMGRRKEVTEYIMDKFDGAQISNYGLYKTDNLLNDLAKACGLPTTGVSADVKATNKATLAEIKGFVKTYESEKGINFDLMKQQAFYTRTNANYDNMLVHFEKMFRKLRFVGTHAAGLAVSGQDLCRYAPLKMLGKKDEVKKPTVTQDMMDLEKLNVVKFDILGLKTMEGLSFMRKAAGLPANWNIADTEYLYDPKIYEQFALGNTAGVFQFTGHGGAGVAQAISSDCFEDVCAASAMNRPGPLQMGMPKMYAENKLSNTVNKDAILYKYTKDTYGTIVYQEQVQAICIGAANFTWEYADKVTKLMKMGNFDMEVLTGTKARVMKDRDNIKDMFIDGCKENGIPNEEAEDLFEAMMVYTFNKGHAAGYTLISIEEMYFKVYHPTIYWWAKLKYTADEFDVAKYQSKAVSEGELIFLPHVNYTAVTSLRKVEGTQVIQLGLDSLKGVGTKAALTIEEERRKRPFRDLDDFVDRCKSRSCTKRTIDVLLEQGALEFKKSRYLSRVTKFNSTLYTKGFGR